MMRPSKSEPVIHGMLPPSAVAAAAAAFGHHHVHHHQQHGTLLSLDDGVGINMLDITSARLQETSTVSSSSTSSSAASSYCDDEYTAKKYHRSIDDSDHDLTKAEYESLWFSRPQFAQSAQSLDSASSHFDDEYVDEREWDAIHERDLLSDFLTLEGLRSSYNSCSTYVSLVDYD